MRHGLLARHERPVRLEETRRQRKPDGEVRSFGQFDPEFRDRHIEVHFPGELGSVTSRRRRECVSPQKLIGCRSWAGGLRRARTLVDVPTVAHADTT
jgi:hypothetical protein